jgi:O-antigen/teichoic acid export membrane protein
MGVAVTLQVAIWLNWIPPGSVYAFPSLPEIIFVASFVALIMGFQPTKAVMANRNLEIKRVITIDLVAQVVAFIFTLIVGWITRSIWSYVAAGLLAALITVVLDRFFLAGPADKLAWDAASRDELSKFGRWVFASSAMSGLASNADRLLLGGLVGPASLGYYSIANNLVGVVDGVASRTFAAIGLPVLSDVERSTPERFSAVYLRIRWLVDTSLVAAAGFIFATGQTIVQTLYDSRYFEAGWMLQYLSFGLYFYRYNLAPSAYLAIGVPQYLTVLNVTKLISLLTLLPLGYMTLGLFGAVLAVAFHMLPTSLWVLYFNSRHGLNSLILELTVLLCWPAGWAMGLATDKAISVIKMLAAGAW